jgi:hypothetical protein|tara:strand:- start:12780 stop:13220 length:441 start_codon:yes stop_codon:yes gene_type:complete
MQNKKGVAGIVLTIIMIVFVLIAVAAIWSVVTNIISTQSEEVDVNSKCLKVDITATQLACGGATNSVCNVTLSRSSTGDVIEGVKLVFTNDAADTNFVSDASGDIGLLETKTLTSIDTGITNTSSVEVVAYFTDSVTGAEQLCSTL